MKKNITEGEISKLVKILKKLNYNPAQQNSAYIFFTIEDEKIVEDDGFQLTVKQNISAKNFLKAGIVVCLDEENKEVCPVLGYADISYSPDFNTEQFIILTKSKISDKEIEFLNDTNCYLVPKQNMFSMFRL